MKSIIRHIAALDGDIEYYVGKSASDNFEIIDAANENDIWFHIDGEPSGHVIAKLPENIDFTKKQLRQIITQGGLVCKENSKYKSQKNVDVVYTYVKYVEKTNILGKVSITNHKIISL
jgi:predicted ribosome quality control (RQC) complex YloA/Tae2 family protein